MPSNAHSRELGHVSWNFDCSIFHIDINVVYLIDSLEELASQGVT